MVRVINITCISCQMKKHSYEILDKFDGFQNRINLIKIESINEINFLLKSKHQFLIKFI